jgi:hemoglobin
MTTEVTLYDRLGGDAALQSVTVAFYDKALADGLLGYFFAPVDMPRQSRMLAEFLALALGSRRGYSGRDLRKAHAGLPDLTDEHFDRVVQLLAESLAEAGIPGPDIAAIAAIAETVRADVLNR